MRPYFLHANLHSFIVCVLPRWDTFIHTVSSNPEIIDVTDCILFSLLGKPRLKNKWASTYSFRSPVNPGSHFFPRFN